MRGIAIRSETLGSHFVCPSCVHRIAGDSRAARSHQRRPRNVSPSISNKFSRNHHIPSNPLAPRTSSRWYSTPAYEAGIPLQNPSVPEERPFMPYTLIDPSRPSEPTRIKSERDHVLDILREGQPDRLLGAFLGPWSISDHLYSLPTPAFVEAFRLLSPAYFIEPYKELHRHFPHLISKAKGIEPLEDYFKRFSMDLWEIVRRRQTAGYALGLAEYTHLLDCARSMGSAAMAEKAWRWMTESGVQPNKECFNYYMEAILWDMTHVAKEKYNVRNTAWNLRKRSFNIRNINWRGYKTGRRGAREQVLKLFDLMISSGIQPDETTYAHIMTASSRDAQPGFIINILKTVWNIDVNALASNEAVPPVTKLAKSSPLHPTSRLLFTVAHVFGQNNDFATALQLVDFISSQYNIEVPNRVWYELYEWAFVLSRRRWGVHKVDKAVGQIRQRAPTDISRSLHSTQGVRQTMPLYNMLAKVAWEDVALFRLLGLLDVGRLVFWRLQSKRRLLDKLIKEHHKLMKKHAPLRNLPWRVGDLNPGDANLVYVRGYADLLHQRDILQIRAARDATYIQRWVKLVLSRPRWDYTTSRKTFWCHRGLPRFIATWKLFLPTRIYYPTPTGMVEFDPRTVWPGNVRKIPENVFDVHEITPVRKVEAPEHVTIGDASSDTDTLMDMETINKAYKELPIGPKFLKGGDDWVGRNLLKVMPARETGEV